MPCCLFGSADVPTAVLLGASRPRVKAGASSLLPVFATVLLCALGPLAKASYKRLCQQELPEGTGLTQGRGQGYSKPPHPKAFQTFSSFFSMLHVSRPGMMNVFDLLELWEAKHTLHILWSHQNSSECHMWMSSISTGTASAPGACSTLSTQRSAAWQIHL